MKKICVVELGGTINSFAESITGEFYGRPTTSGYDLIQELEIEELNIERFSLFQKISQELTTQDLIAFANQLNLKISSDEFFGAVVCMGTNTIEDVAYFIGLVIKTNKPIVFTGSQYPQGSLCFDGKLNLFNAITVASSSDAMNLGALLTFNGVVSSARDSYKVNPGYLDNFIMDNGPGYVGDVLAGIFKLRYVPNYRHTFKTEFDIKLIKNLAKICVIYAHIGLDAFLIDSVMESGALGIVSAGFGKGYQSIQITERLHEAVNSGIFVVRCSRLGITYTGIDEKYDDKYSFIVSKGLMPNKSSVLLSVALLFTQEKRELQRIFEEY